MKLQGGITGLVIGPPGTGKSTFLGTITEVPGIDRALLLAPKPREVNSFKYRENADDLDVEVFRDNLWAPAADSFQSGAFTKLFHRILALYDDTTYDAILLDPFTDVVALAAHELLEGERAATPRDLRDSIGFYGSLKYKLKDFTQALTGLASPSLVKPKHVFASVHAQPTKEEDMKGKSTAEGNAKGTEFLGEALPMIEGSYRREIAGEFDIVGYTSLAYTNERQGAKLVRKSEYVVQLDADPERHAKLALLPRGASPSIPNSMVDLFRLIQGGE